MVSDASCQRTTSGACFGHQACREHGHAAMSSCITFAASVSCLPLALESSPSNSTCDSAHIQLILAELLQTAGAWVQTTQWMHSRRYAWRLVAWQLHLLLLAYGLSTLTRAPGEQQMSSTCVRIVCCQQCAVPSALRTSSV